MEVYKKSPNFNPIFAAKWLLNLYKNMAKTKNATVREIIIDRCLGDRRKRYTESNITDACYRQLEENKTFNSIWKRDLVLFNKYYLLG